MVPTLIVLALLALGVAIVAFATRRSPSLPTAAASEQDVVWNDPITPAGESSAADPFAHAPLPSSDAAAGPVTADTGRSDRQG